MAKSKFDSCILPNLDAIEEMVKNGVTDKDIAKAIHVGYRTFFRYISEGQAAETKEKNGGELSEKEKGYLQLWQTYARARQTPDAIVESALFLSCQDRTIPKTTIIKRYDPEGNLIYQEEKTELVPVAASVPAQQFYLANKKRRDWEYKPDATKTDEKTETASIVLVPKEKLVPPKAGDES